MEKLVTGIHDFQKKVFRSQREFFERLAQGQSPEVLFLTCSDSRINPNLITQTAPGELFIARNAGNIIPAHQGGSVSGEAATIEYAIAALKVKDVVVCGHTHCGAMAALLDPESVSELPTVKAWLSHAETTRRVVKSRYAHLAGNALLSATVQENVLAQIENLRTHPAVAVALSEGTLKLHGWVYKLETGEVFAFDPDEGQFRPVAKLKGGSDRLKRLRPDRDRTTELASI